MTERKLEFTVKRINNGSSAKGQEWIQSETRGLNRYWTMSKSEWTTVLRGSEHKHEGYLRRQVDSKREVTSGRGLAGKWVFQVTIPAIITTGVKTVQSTILYPEVESPFQLKLRFTEKNKENKREPSRDSIAAIIFKMSYIFHEILGLSLITWYVFYALLWIICGFVRSDLNLTHLRFLGVRVLFTS